MKIINKIIIWLFERYAQTDWAIMCQERMDKEMMEKYQLKDKNELDQLYSDCNPPLPENDNPSDLGGETLEEAYYSGKEDGYNQALKDNN